MTLAADLPDASFASEARAAGRRPRWPYLCFFVLSAVFGWQLLFAGRILLPTNPTTVAPWIGDASPEATSVPSNGLMMDTLIFTLPARIYNHEKLRSGEIPFWNPHVFAGYPHLALIQNNALYPLSAVFDLFEPISGMGYSICLHLALAGCLMFAFLRAQGLGDGAALLGGAAFELNGMFLVRASAPSYVFSGTWLPLMLLGALRIARSGRLRAGWPLLLATAASVLGGHPQITSLGLCVAGAYLLLETWSASVRGAVLPRLATSAGGAALLVVLGIGLAGYQVVPFLELMANSARGGVSLDVYRKAALPVAGLLQAIVPDVFGHPVELSYWFAEQAHLVDGIGSDERSWALNYCGGNLYTGLVPLVLAAVAVARSTHHREVVFFALTALASLGVLFGTPLLDTAYFLLPGFRFSRPDRIIFVYMAALSVLTAYGFASLTQESAARQGRTPRATALALAAFAAAIALWPLLPRLADPSARSDLSAWLGEALTRWSAQRDMLLPQIVGTILLLVALIALSRSAVARRVPRSLAVTAWTVLLVAPLLLFGWRFNPMQYPPRLGETATEQLLMRESNGPPMRVARILSGLRQVLPANLAQAIGVDDANGASAAGVRAYLDLIDAADPGAVAKQKYFRGFRDPDVSRGRLLDLLNVGVVLSDLEVAADYERLASEDGITIYRNPRVLPRFYVVEAAESYASPAAGRARLLAPDFDPAIRGLVLDGAATTALPGSPPSREQAPAKVAIESATDRAIRMRIDAPRGGILVSSEVVYPGWETRLDGTSVPTLVVNTAFRGVALPAGVHEVEMVFVPRSFYVGVAVSVASLLVIAVLWRPRRDDLPATRA